MEQNGYQEMLNLFRLEKLPLVVFNCSLQPLIEPDFAQNYIIKGQKARVKDIKGEFARESSKKSFARGAVINRTVSPEGLWRFSLKLFKAQHFTDLSNKI